MWILLIIGASFLVYNYLSMLLYYTVTALVIFFRFPRGGIKKILMHMSGTAAHRIGYSILLIPVTSTLLVITASIFLFYGECFMLDTTIACSLGTWIQTIYLAIIFISILFSGVPFVAIYLINHIFLGVFHKLAIQNNLDH